MGQGGGRSAAPGVNERGAMRAFCGWRGGAPEGGRGILVAAVGVLLEWVWRGVNGVGAGRRDG